MDEARFPAALAAAIGRDRIVATEPEGSARVRFLPRPEFAHSGGRVVQGGFVAAWLDHAMAVAVAARDAAVGVATLEIKVTYLEPVPVQPVIAEARVLRWGRSIVFLEAGLRAEDGRLLATASSSGKLLFR